MKNTLNESFLDCDNFSLKKCNILLYNKHTIKKFYANKWKQK